MGGVSGSLPAGTSDAHHPLVSRMRSNPLAPDKESPMTFAPLHAAALAAALVSLPIAAAAADTNTPVSDASQAHSPAPIQLSLWDSVQVIDRDRSIHGLRLTLPYGRNWDVQGVDIGIVNRTNHDHSGVQLSIAGFVDGQMKGLQYNWLISSVGGEAQGAQFGIVNSVGTLQGAQFGAVNY